MTATAPYALVNARMPKGNMGQWQERHLAAVRMPRGPEAPIVNLVNAWTGYANQHRARYDSGIGDDGVLGPAWAQIGASIRTLLNGESGQLDCGTIDGFVCDVLTAEGINPDTL